jgi:UDPglucose 6-dehydrogenase
VKIAVIGTGYVGLVSGACFAEFGIDVVCMDMDADKIAALQRGVLPIYEPGLDALVAENAESGRLSFTHDLPSAIRGADVVMIAVGTPSRRGDGHADLTYVEAAARSVAPLIDRYCVVVTKSTVPVGTGRRVLAIMREAAPDADFDVVSNPEFLREGSAIGDFMRPDRVVIGAETERAQKVMRRLYRPLFLLETPIVFTSLESAEVTKYAANAFLATKIAFINEVADLCERVGADVQDVAKAMGLDGRIGGKFLHTGPGFGGSCFPKDTRAMARTGEQYGAELSIVNAVVAGNERRKAAMAERVIAAAGEGGSLAGRTIGVLGLAFKPNTDDMREAPSLEIVPRLVAAGATVRAYDPVAMHEARKVLADVEYVDDAYAAVEGADALVLLTEWNEFRALDLDRVRAALRRPLVIDLRNVYRPDEMRAASLEYVSLGRPAVRLPAAAEVGAAAH